MGEMSFDRVSQKGEGVAVLLATGFHHRQHRLDKAAAAGALGPEGKFTPNHCVTQRSLARIVRRFDPVVTQEHPQPRAMCVQFPARAARIDVTAFGAAQQQTLHVATDRSHPTQQCRPRNLSGTKVGPMLEQLACRMPQTIAEVLCARVAAVDHRLEIAFQMGPAPLQTAQMPVHFCPIAGDDAVELLAKQLAERCRFAGGSDRKHRKQSGDECPQPSLVVFLFGSRFVNVQLLLSGQLSRQRIIRRPNGRRHLVFDLHRQRCATGLAQERTQELSRPPLALR